MANKKKKSFSYEYGGNSLGMPKWSPMMKAEYGYGSSGANQGLDLVTNNIDKFLPPTNPLSIGLKVLNTGIDIFNVHRTNQKIKQEKKTLNEKRELTNLLMDPDSNKDSLNMTQAIAANQSDIARIENLEEQNMMTDAILPNVKNLGNAALGTAGVDYTADDFDAGKFATSLFSGNAAYGGSQQPTENYEAEGGEVIQHEPGNQPGTTGSMQTVGNNPTLSKLEGKSHNRGGEAVSSEGDQYVYSNKLKSDEWGITFAAAAEKIANKIEKFEEAASDGDKITKDTAAAMIQEWNGRLLKLKEEQERKREEKFMEMLQSGASMEELSQNFPDILEKFMQENLDPQQQSGAPQPAMDQGLGEAEAMLPPEMRYGGKMYEHGGPHDNDPWLPRTDVGTDATQGRLTEMTFSGYGQPLNIYSNDPKMSEYLQGLSGTGDQLGTKWWEGLPPDLKAKAGDLGITGLGSFGDDVNLITQFEQAANELGYEMPVEELGQGKVGEYILGVSDWSPKSTLSLETKGFEGFPNKEFTLNPDDFKVEEEGGRKKWTAEPTTDPLFGPFPPKRKPNPIDFSFLDTKRNIDLGEGNEDIFNTGTGEDNDPENDPETETGTPNRKSRLNLPNTWNILKQKMKFTNNEENAKDPTNTKEKRGFDWTALQNMKLSPWYNLSKSKEPLTPSQMRLNPFYHELTTREDRDINIQPILNRNLDMMYTNLDLSKDFTGGSSSSIMSAFNMADQTRQQGDSSAWGQKLSGEAQIEAQNDAMKMGLGEGFAAEQRRIDELIGMKQGKRQEFEKTFFEQIDAMGDLNRQERNMRDQDAMLSKILQKIYGINPADFKTKFGGSPPEYDVNQIDWNDPEIISLIKSLLKN